MKAPSPPVGQAPTSRLTDHSPVLRYLRSPLFVRDALLVLLTLAALEGVCACGFIQWDDGMYLAENCHTLNGLSRENISWAFTTWEAANWHPLTWLSWQIDATFASPTPLVFHRTNLLLHLANVLLLAELLRRMTGALWRSAAVAALFAIHPLRVESVAWVSERKDVLFTLFGLLALAGYLHYARKPSWGRMALVLLAQEASLMSKPMLVTLPCLLLLLDFWPLRRLSWQSSQHAPRDDSSITRSVMATLPGEPTFAVASAQRLVLEKLPLFLLSVGWCVLTFLAQTHSDGIASLSVVPISLRLTNATTSTVCYIRQMFWPANLSIDYPYPYGGLPWGQVLAEALLLAGITAVVCWQVRRRPYLFVGWFWYLGTLVPVLGFVQNSRQPHADRFTYVPMIGLYIMLAWGASELLSRRRLALTALTTAVLVVCLFLTRAQVRHWQGEFEIWEHAVSACPENPMARVHYGWALLAEKRPEEALLQARAADRLKPRSPAVQALLGAIHESGGRLDEAEAYYREAVRLGPPEGGARGDLERIWNEKKKRAGKQERTSP